jgi:hypothetical protein
MLRVILLLVLVVAGVVAYNAYQPMAADAPFKSVVVTSPTAAASFDQKVNPVMTSVASGAKKQVHLVLTESEITSKLQQRAPSGEVGGLQNIQVKLGTDVATVYGTASIGGVAVPLEAVARLSASQGKLSVDVTSIKAQNVNLPAAIISQLMAQVKQTTGLNGFESIDVGIDVTSVRIAPGQLQIDGLTR